MFKDHDTGIEAFKTFVSLTDDFIHENVAKEAAPLELSEEFDESEELLEVA